MGSKKAVTKILAIDDSESFLEIYRKILHQKPTKKEGNYDVRVANNARDGLAFFDHFQPQVVILDINLPDISGFDVYNEIRRRSARNNYVGVIFVSAHATPDVAVKCLELGADDFCSKNNTAIELRARIRSVIRTKSYIDSLHASNEKLRDANERLARITITDELTGLHNMRYFKKRLNQEFIRSKRYDKYLTAVMFDVDNFKEVNDSTNHLMGSHVLSKIGHIVADSIRAVDIAARFGGDEYVIMMPETGPEGGYTAGQRIYERIRGTTFCNGEFKVNVSVSIGIATYGPGYEWFNNGTELMRQADLYLYEAKRKGKGKLIDYHHSDDREKDKSKAMG